MITIGLTGSIAMGKSETAKMFAARDIPVFDSDAAVHEMYGQGGAAVSHIAQLAPSAITDGAVDRRKLAALVIEDQSLLSRIEAIVHPLVRARQKAFVAESEARGCDIVVLDIPLLFEKGREAEVDVIAVVSAGAELQRERALKRPNMTQEKLDFVIARQMPDEQKRSRAHYVIDTSRSLEDTDREVGRVIAAIRNKAGHS
jgi:dephospho-CoA kinase